MFFRRLLIERVDLMATGTEILKMRRITKNFLGVRALHNVVHNGPRNSCPYGKWQVNPLIKGLPVLKNLRLARYGLAKIIL